jgi:hypothetical protein
MWWLMEWKLYNRNVVRGRTHIEKICSLGRSLRRSIEGGHDLIKDNVGNSWHIRKTRITRGAKKCMVFQGWVGYSTKCCWEVKKHSNRKVTTGSGKIVVISKPNKRSSYEIMEWTKVW